MQFYNQYITASWSGPKGDRLIQVSLYDFTSNLIYITVMVLLSLHVCVETVIVNVSSFLRITTNCAAYNVAAT